jgi:hypothetical protein
MFCNACGTFNPDNATFCSQCGARLAPPGAHPYTFARWHRLAATATTTTPHPLRLITPKVASQLAEHLWT